MKQHLQRTRQIEAAIRTELLRDESTTRVPAKRILVDLLDIRIKVLDQLIREHGEDKEA